MTPTLYLAIAGIPPQIEDGFASAFAKLARGRDVHLLSLLKLHLSKGYTEGYAKTLYDRLALKLKERDFGDRENLLRNANLVLLYLDKQDESESELVAHFGTEALILSLIVPEIASKLLATRNQRNSLVNQLINEARGAMKHARSLFSVIGEEVTNRDNKTCLLLPPKTFGGPMQHIIDRVQKAGRKREDANVLKSNIEHISRSLPKHERRYFQGHGGLVFQTPAKTGPRHGLAPIWGDGNHNPMCVIRGRLRFGASYNPKFHYDCQIPKGSKRDFPGCHETAGIFGAQGHVNVAPNDSARN